MTEPHTCVVTPLVLAQLQQVRHLCCSYASRPALQTTPERRNGNFMPVLKYEDSSGHRIETYFPKPNLIRKHVIKVYKNVSKHYFMSFLSC